MLEHDAGQGIDKGKSLGMKVLEDGIGAPATDKFHDVVVDTTTKECHGTTSTGAASSDVVRLDAQVGLCRGGNLKACRKKRGSDVDPCAIVKGGTQGSVRGGIVELQVQNLTNHSVNGTRDSVTTATVSQLFTTSAVLLGVKEDRRMGSRTDIIERTHEQVELLVTDGQPEMSKKQGSGAVGGFAVFTWSE